MARLIVACVLLVTAVAPPAAAAKGRVELRSTPPADLRAGETWRADLLVHATIPELAASDPPTILIHSEAAGWTKITATPAAGDPGAYTADVVFPDAGTWTYHVHDPIAGGGYDFEPIVVAAAPGGGLPLWVVLGLAIAAAPAAAIVARRRKTLR